MIDLDNIDFNDSPWIWILLMLMFGFQKRKEEREIMKERIEAKISDIVEDILAKDVKDITYEDYHILESKLMSIRIESSYSFNSCCCATEAELKAEEDK